jgi:SAM-dependent methyltransferase
MVRLASRHNRTAVRAGTVILHRGDGTDLPLPGGHVNAAVSVHTICFWDNPAAVTAELGRVLRPGGRLVLGLRDPDLPLTDRADPTVYQRIPLDHLRGMLATAGFEPIDVVRDPHAAAETVWVVARRRAREVHA